MSKRSSDPVNISDVLKEFVDSNKLQKGFDKINVVDAWKHQMGASITKYTTAIHLERDTLFVQLSSSVLREELSYGNDKIIKLLNEFLGKEIIKKLVLR